MQFNSPAEDRATSSVSEPALPELRQAYVSTRSLALSDPREREWQLPRDAKLCESSRALAESNTPERHLALAETAKSFLEARGVACRVETTELSARVVVEPDRSAGWLGRRAATLARENYRLAFDTRAHLSESAFFSPEERLVAIPWGNMASRGPSPGAKHEFAHYIALLGGELPLVKICPAGPNRGPFWLSRVFEETYGAAAGGYVVGEEIAYGATAKEFLIETGRLLASEQRLSERGASGDARLMALEAAGNALSASWDALASAHAFLLNDRSILTAVRECRTSLRALQGDHTFDRELTIISPDESQRADAWTKILFRREDAAPGEAKLGKRAARGFLRRLEKTLSAQSAKIEDLGGRAKGLEEVIETRMSEAARAIPSPELATLAQRAASDIAELYAKRGFEEEALRDAAPLWKRLALLTKERLDRLEVPASIERHPIGIRDEDGITIRTHTLYRIVIDKSSGSDHWLSRLADRVEGDLYLLSSNPSLGRMLSRGGRELQLPFDALDSDRPTPGVLAGLAARWHQESLAFDRAAVMGETREVLPLARLGARQLPMRVFTAASEAGSEDGFSNDGFIDTTEAHLLAYEQKAYLAQAEKLLAQGGRPPEALRALERAEESGRAASWRLAEMIDVFSRALDEAGRQPLSELVGLAPDRDERFGTYCLSLGDGRQIEFTRYQIEARYPAKPPRWHPDGNFDPHSSEHSFDPASLLPVLEHVLDGLERQRSRVEKRLMETEKLPRRPSR